MPRHYKPSAWSRLFGVFKRRVPPPSPRPRSVTLPDAPSTEPAQAEVEQGDSPIVATVAAGKGHEVDMGNVTVLRPAPSPAAKNSEERAQDLPSEHPERPQANEADEHPQAEENDHDQTGQAGRTRVGNGNKLLILETSSRSLVMGLKWMAIVVDQRRNPDAALSIARKARASFYAPGVKGVVGFGVPDAQAKERLSRFSRSAKDSAGQRRTAPVCAALLAASQAQNAVFALPLPTQDPNGLVWLLHVQAGRPVGSERIVTTDVALDLIEQEFTPILMDSTGQASAQLWSELPLPLQLRQVVKAKPYSIRDLAQLPVQPSMHLLPASYRAELAATVRRMPALVKFSAVAGALGFVGYSAYHQLIVVPGQKAELASRQRERLDQLDMAQQQLRARRNALMASLAPDVTLQPLRARLDELPLIVEGWALRTVNCNASLGASTGSAADPVAKAWDCAAEYEVANRERFAPYSRLVAMLPAWAQLRTAPPMKFSLAFQVQTPAAPVSLDTLPTVAEMDLGYVSQLQQHLKFLKDAVEIKFSGLTLEIPRGPDGAVIPLPPNFALPLRSPLVFTSPIAQLDAMLAALPPAADWRGLRLSVPSPERAQDITVSLTGVVYAK